MVKKYFRQLNIKRFKMLIFVFLIFFIPRIIGLGPDMSNYDASYWYPRMDNFSKHILRAEYKETYQKYHPGVILLWTSGTSKYAFEKTFETVFGYSPRFMPNHFSKLNFVAIFPLVFIISLLGTFMYYMLSKIINTRYALIFAIVLSLEPFFLGVSRFLHLSALTSMFMFTSFLCVYYYYFKEKTNKWLLYISSVLLGLGVLTKIDAIIALPVIFTVILMYEFLLLAKPNFSSFKIKSNFKDYIKVIFSKNYLLNTFTTLFIYGLLLFMTFYLLFPSMWVAPFWTIDKIISEGIQDTAFSSSGAQTVTGIKYLFYPETILFRSLPTFSLGILGGVIILIYSFFNKKSKLNSTQKGFLSLVLFFIIFNILILSIPDKIKDRYLINLYPPLAVFSALFLYYAYESKSKLIKYGVIFCFVFTYILTIFRYHPVYSYYYSDLIGGPSGYAKLGLDIKNRGEFYAQVANHINKTDDNPYVRNVILADREKTKTFAQFFFGKTYTNPRYLQKGEFADYIITTPNYEKEVSQKLQDKCNFEKSFGPKNPFGYSVIQLYKCDNVTKEYKDFRN